MRFWTYVFWTWLCILPGTVLYVVGAEAVARGLATRMIPWILIIAFAGALVILLLLVYLARRRLQKEERENRNRILPGRSRRHDLVSHDAAGSI